MKIPATSLLFLLIATGLFFPFAAAAGITITANQADYYFTPGETVNISLAISSTYSDAVDGKFQVVTTGQLQKTGTVMLSTKNRVFDRTIPAGDSLLTVGAGTSTVPETIRIQVAFQYMDASPVKVTLPEIRVHFVENLPVNAAQQSPVTSTSGAGIPGGLGTSSVQIVQQPVSVRQQAGWDGTPQNDLTTGQMAGENENETAEEGNGTGILPAEKPSPVNYFMYGMIAFIALLAAMCCWLLSRRLKSKGNTPVAPDMPPAPVPTDHSTEALHLLAAAESVWAENEYAVAYGLAGQALRLFLSHEYGDGRQATVAEIASLINRTGPGSAPVMDLLERCSDVEFAKGAPDPLEFSAMVRQIRSIITGD